MAKRGPSKLRNNDEYALYKGDKLLAIGTRDELAEFHGVTRQTIYYYSTPASKRKDRKGNKLVVIKLEDD